MNSEKDSGRNIEDELRIALSQLRRCQEDRKRSEDMYEGNAHMLESIIGELKETKEKRDEFFNRLIKQEEFWRRKIAGELHDKLGQDLVALRNFTYLAKKSLTTENTRTPNEALEHIDNIEEKVSLLQKILASMLTELWPEAIDNIGLEASIWELIEDFKKQHPDIHIDYKDDVRLGVSHNAIYIYRIIAESLTNISKHANATNIGISLIKIDNEKYSIVIEDDGIGLPEEVIYGYGLNGIQERVSVMNGKMSIKSKKRGGTLLSIILPYHHNV